jgi:hypothetical protein
MPARNASQREAGGSVSLRRGGRAIHTERWSACKGCGAEKDQFDKEEQA